MTVLDRLAHRLGRRDEVPNQDLARELAATRDTAAIRELAAQLRTRDPRMQSDCVKVLYETGYLDPALVSPHVADFLHLLSSRNNRLVWGGMIALSTIAALEPAALFAERRLLQKTIETGSVITVDNGIKTLALVASRSAEYRETLFPYLLSHLRDCRPKDVPQHAESILVAVDATVKHSFIETLTARLPGMPASRATRLRRVLKEAARR